MELMGRISRFGFTNSALQSLGGAAAEVGTIPHSRLLLVQHQAVQSASISAIQTPAKLCDDCAKTASSNGTVPFQDIANSWSYRMRGHELRTQTNANHTTTAMAVLHSNAPLGSQATLIQ